MSAIDELKRTASGWLQEHGEWLSAFNQRIYSNAETAWREYRSSAAYVDVLTREGFSVETGSGGMPTAFCATWGDGRPVLACSAEYDGVPGQNQEAVATRRCRAGLHPAAPGDPDPHSALGTAGLAAILAAKEAITKHGLTATLRLYGEPAEKMCGGKAVHAARGYYDDLDAVLAYHPEFANTVMGEIQSGPYASCVFTFTCDEIGPHIDPGLHVLDEPNLGLRAPGALDAVFLMYSTAKALKERMLPSTAGWSMSENILVASQATADNLASAIGHIQYTWRAARLDSVRDVYDALAEIARHAAATTGCTPTVRWVSRLRPGLYNRPLADLLYANLATVGPPTWDAEAIEFARELERGMGIDPSPSPFIAEASKLQSPEERDAEWRAQLPPWQTHFTWDDYVEYTWHAPTARLFTAKPVLKAARSWSHWSALALNGLPAAIDPTWRTAATVMSHTLIDLIAHPGALAAAHADFVERTGGGRGGKRWLAPLHPKDFVAPVDLPWPEYVTTARGREWWLPTPATRGDPL